MAEDIRFAKLTADLIRFQAKKEDKEKVKATDFLIGDYKYEPPRAKEVHERLQRNYEELLNPKKEPSPDQFYFGWYDFNNNDS